MITLEGKKLFQLFKGYNLERFYDVHMGNLQIEIEDYTPQVEADVEKFLFENKNFIKGIIDEDDWKMIYVCHKDNLE